MGSQQENNNPGRVSEQESSCIREDNLSTLETELLHPFSQKIDQFSAREIVELMNQVDADVIQAVGDQVDEIAAAIEVIKDRFHQGGRLIYVGAGTSGRLGVLDAAECPPTFSTAPEMVRAVIAGGSQALVQAVEGVEDRPEQGAFDLGQLAISQTDVVVGIASSGRTPYCIGAIKKARDCGAYTIGLVCNRSTLLERHVDCLIAPITGPEVIAGSTRLKAGTATKMVLNMLTTGAMVRSGKTYGNLMVDLKPTNSKLWTRACRMIASLSPLSFQQSAELITRSNGEVKTALVSGMASVSLEEARMSLQSVQGHVHEALSNLHSKRASDNKETLFCPEGALSDCVLGVDGGATSTVALLVNPQGEVMGRGESGPSNPSAVGFSNAQNGMLAAIEQCFQRTAKRPQAGVAGLCIGMAGAGRQEEQRRLHDWAVERGLARWINVVSDVALLLAAYPGQNSPTIPLYRESRWGMAVVAGTGSIVVGKSRLGEEVRAGGWGPVLGDEGSGYWIVVEAVRAVLEHQDGHRRPTILSKILCRKLDLRKPEDLIRWISSSAGNRHEIAALVPEVQMAADQGDTVATAIFRNAAKLLYGQVECVAHRIGSSKEPIPLAVSGGILQHCQSVRTRFLEQLAESEFDFQVRMVSDPAIGAVQLAFEHLLNH